MFNPAIEWFSKSESIADEDERCPVEGMGEIGGNAAFDIADSTSQLFDVFLGDFALDEVFLGLLNGGCGGFALLESRVEGVHEALGAAVVDRPEG